MNAKSQLPCIGNSPVLFLDLDGVMSVGPEAKSDSFCVTHSCATALKRIVEQVPGLAVVVTDENRADASKMSRLTSFLRSFGVPSEVIADVTPQVEAAPDAPAPQRADEIRAWLSKHSEVRSHVTLDDNYVAYASGAGFSRVLYVDPAVGLDDRIAAEAVRILHAYK